MTMNADDPRITAYALGELDDEARAEVERWLEDNPEARDEVEQIQAMAELLHEELRQEPDGALTTEQRETVLQQANDQGEPERRQPWIMRPAVTGSLAMAAMVLVVLCGSYLMLYQGSPAPRRVGPVSLGVDLPPASSKQSLRVTTAPSGAAVITDGKTKGARPKWDSKGWGPLHFGLTEPHYHSYSFSAPSTKGKGAVYTSGAAGDIDVDSGKHVVAIRGSMNGKPVRVVVPQPYNDVGGEGEGRGVLKGEKKSREEYRPPPENPFLLVARAPLSTFSVDVDTAAYANVRRFLNQSTLPPAGAVRIEEMINYFSYDYPAPSGPHPFSVNVETGPAPWRPKHRLVRIGLRGKPVLKKRRPPSNLVFLIDVSGSMSDLNKLPLLRRGMKLLVDQLTENDRVALVVYAGASGLVLPSTAVTEKNRPKILSALERLSAGGSTNGGAGIGLAYQTAVAHFVKGGVNRVLLATDGDFNVGISDRRGLVKLIKQKAKSGVFLSVLGFGMGNLKDATLEQLTNKGNGNYAYIDTINEARKVLVEQMTGTLITIAKDVKIQVEFNPARAQAYRLIGYENRRLASKDFANDKKDAGEIGAGHTVTALYEVVPPGVKLPPAAKLKYQRPSKPAGSASKELLTVRLRYKAPAGKRSTLMEVPATDAGAALKKTSADFKLAAAVAWFGMTLRGSRHAGKAPHKSIISLARAGLGRDRNGRRAELIKLVKKAAKLSKRKK